jgi:hypothetical protein
MAMALEVKQAPPWSQEDVCRWQNSECKGGIKPLEAVGWKQVKLCAFHRSRVRGWSGWGKPASTAEERAVYIDHLIDELVQLWRVSV